MPVACRRADTRGLEEGLFILPESWARDVDSQAWEAGRITEAIGRSTDRPSEISAEYQETEDPQSPLAIILVIGVMVLILLLAIWSRMP